MKKFYAILLGFTAILLAVTAAYFSVFGLSKLFIGAALSVIIMAGTLEFSKIVVVSWLHQYWDTMAKQLKAYLFVAIVVLMIVTSAGIYGFLSNAYSRVSADLDKMSGGIQLLDKKIATKREEKTRLDEQIKTKNDRVISLTQLRKGQETRLDSLYQRGWMAAAKKTEAVIGQADDNIATLNLEINKISGKIEVLNDSISKYETKKLDIADSDIASEVGPLKYISKLTGASMDTVVNYLILLLIFVFDPLAVALVIATSSMIKMIRKEKEGKNINDRNDAFKKKVKYVSDEQGNFKLQNEESSNTEEPVEEEEQIFEHPAISNNVSTEDQAVENFVVEELPLEESPAEEVFAEEEVVEDSLVEKHQELKSFNIKEGTIITDIFTATTSDNKVETITETQPAEGELVINDENRQSLYLQLLEIFYDNGRSGSGTEIPIYTDFKKMIYNKMPNINEKDVKDFLVVCNLFKITEFKQNVGYFQKDYQTAMFLMSKI